MKNSIFVQIASYRDPQLIPTILDLLTNAQHPENLHTSVCWQHGDDETLSIFINNDFALVKTEKDNRVHNFPVHYLTRNGATFSIIDVPFPKTKGACWARNTIQQLYDNEMFTLQIDSHHRFIKYWDQVLIDMLESLRRQGAQKPVLTAYPLSFDPDNDPDARSYDPLKITFHKFAHKGYLILKSELISNWQALKTPIPARFYAAGFAFADGSFAVEVQHDPEYFFHGEEINIAVRAFTHGYSLFHPHCPVTWHEYIRKKKKKMWDDHSAENKEKNLIESAWYERDQLSHKRNRILFGIDGEDQSQIDFGKYGLGTVRTLHQYEEYAGISFANRGVHQDTLDGKPPPNTILYTTADEWKKAFFRSNDIPILVHKSELGDIEDDFDFFYVGVHDAQGTELYRKDLNRDDIQKYLQTEWISYNLEFLTDQKIPISYTFWTHSASKGWIKYIKKDIGYF